MSPETFQDLWPTICTPSESPGDYQRACESFVREYYPYVKAHAYLRVPDDHAAQDIAQEVFFDLFKDAPCGKFDYVTGPAILCRVLYTIANCRASDWLRKRDPSATVSEEHLGHLAYEESRSPNSNGTEASEAETPDSPQSLKTGNRRADAFREAISTLSQEDKDILLLRFGYDYRPCEIAVQLGVTQQCVCMRIDRARARLRGVLGADFEWPEPTPNNIKKGTTNVQ